MAYPARGDEMVNQEPEAVLEAEERADQDVGRSFRWMALAPVAAFGLGGILYARGRRSLGITAIVTGLLTATGSVAFRFVRGHQQRDEASHEELEELDAERAAIETGRL